MEETKKCPYCGEEILAVAKKCKHCGEWLKEETTNKDTAALNDKDDVVEETDTSVSSWSRYPWKEAIIKVSGGVLFVLLLFILNQACSNNIVPSMEGKWTYEWQDSTEYDDEDWLRKEYISTNSVDIFNEDKTEIDKSVIVYTFEIDDSEYSGTAVLKYETIYKGTWEQKGDQLILVCKTYDWNLIESFIKPNPRDYSIDEDYYLNSLNEMIEELYQEENYNKRTQTIVDVDYDANTIIVEEDGETMLVKKDGKIKKRWFGVSLRKNKAKGIRKMVIRR